MNYKTMLAKLQKRTDNMVAMRANGATLEAIAAKYGISRQRVYQILAAAK